ncbi:MAG: small basic family protein [Caldicoprobacterales bacterium]|jgi:small basic protein|nr:small basic family protein [Clostridia bacterium]MDI9512136.1 small basic family protein [Bacillota bacterium]NLH58352.1 small basic family protein [Clostridiales bacterium]
MWLPLLGIIIGIVLGMVLPFSVPVAYSSYMSVALLAALDSVFGGIKSHLEDQFETDVFLTGFFGNAVLAAGLTYIGDRLDVPIYLAAIFVFGSRLFQNFALIRRYLLQRLKKKPNTATNNEE